MHENINWAKIPAAQYPVFQNLRKTKRQFKGESIYTDGNYFYYKDALHGEVEKCDRRGKHVGVLLPTGEVHPMKKAVKGRTINQYI